MLITLTTPINERLHLTSVYGEEELSGPFFYRIELLSPASNISPETILGKEASLGFLQADNCSRRYINGIVSSIQQHESTTTMNHYTLTLRPRIWLLTQITDCRVFQNQTIPEILTRIYTTIGGSIKNNLTAVYSKHDYIVQYNESSFNFITRLMADNGIFYYFEHTNNSHTLVLTDKVDALPQCSSAPVLTCHSANISDNPANEISEPTVSSSVVSNRCSLNDYNFQIPKSNLLASSSNTGTREIYLYGSAHQQQNSGATIAGKRLDAIEATANTITATTPASGLYPGSIFKIISSSRNHINRSYLTTALAVSANLEHYSATLTAIPDNQPFGITRNFEHPVILGTQTALVVGKKGKEIWTDKYGRVRIQFYWDREGKKDEKSGCWVRVAQIWAGKGFGTVFIPRIGQEVVVSFINGDINRPIITGLVYNADQTVPFPLPANSTLSGVKTNSSPGGNGYNALTFEDKKDNELIAIHAQKDLKMNIINSRTTDITEADDILTLNKGNLITQVKEGDYRLSVGGDLTIEIAGKLRINTKESTTILSSGKFTQSSDSTLELSANTRLTTSSSTFDINSKVSGSINGGTSLTATGTTINIG